MPFPFEAAVPFVAITAMFTITGSLLHLVRKGSNDGKARHILQG
jgi:hypothetical protein